MAPARHSSFLPIPVAMNSFDNFSNLVNDNLFKIKSDFFKIASFESGVASSPPSFLKTPAFHRVSSLTSKGLQSSKGGAVSLSCLFFLFMLTSPPNRFAFVIASISCKRVGDSHLHSSGGPTTLSSPSPLVCSQARGGATNDRRSDKSSAATIRATAFSISPFPSFGFKSSSGRDLPLDQLSAGPPPELLLPPCPPRPPPSSLLSL
mmetsp:Transcript_9975/g.14908  ORF Transcript_9975/g.14908 Transcript_9975/m.14908 type:complete len:206 (+) Transcript_9975:2431-3048(+)